MPATGNITTLSIDDSDLHARRAGLSRFASDGQTEWSAQIDAGTVDALTAFEQIKGHAPDRCVAMNDDSWKRILVFYTLRVIFSGFHDDSSQLESDKWAVYAEGALKSFLYRWDDDDSGDVDETDEKHSGWNVELQR